MHSITQQQTESTEAPRLTPALWVTETQFSDRTGIPAATLRGWRYKDRRAGREQALPGYPVYRKWGRDLVRYFVGDL